MVATVDREFQRAANIRVQSRHVVKSGFIAIVAMDNKMQVQYMTAHVVETYHSFFVIY